MRLFLFDSHWSYTVCLSSYPNNLKSLTGQSLNVFADPLKAKLHLDVRSFGQAYLASHGATDSASLQKPRSDLWDRVLDRVLAVSHTPERFCLTPVSTKTVTGCYHMSRVMRTPASLHMRKQRRRSVAQSNRS